jgi:hypothetical protein
VAKEEILLMAHLMRRAGFGASRAETEERVGKGYEETVEELLYPAVQKSVNLFEFLRYHPMQWKPGTLAGVGHSSWVYRMINTQAPLEEKIALFWHQVFATGVNKVDHWHEIANMVDTLRAKGLGNFRDLLENVARTPAMIFWLDNHENHSYAVNENWGRELLELFSMGVGNYTEEDVRDVSRAFTGWTILPTLPRFTLGRFDWDFDYKPEDHDDEPKTVLGHKGKLNGDDVIDIILKQPACARFIARHIYNFFVADEPPVPTWFIDPPQDSEAVQTIAEILIKSDYDIRHTLRIVFNSDFFKTARFTRVKNPTEVVVGTLRMAGVDEFPGPQILDYAEHMTNMGQELLNPPTVEGWHTGREWINTGSFVKRTNFFTDILSDTTLIGVQDIHRRIDDCGDLSPEEFVDVCLDMIGSIEVRTETRRDLMEHAEQDGTFRGSKKGQNLTRITEMIQLIVATQDYKYA